ncbi:unnamed protein product [Ilex paraguariensis]|uniref:Uncharacterized protein n=1 Tax=Ilex paraguariensis TaxID=185542 RepID=A0ABC8QX05_9AQUA
MSLKGNKQRGFVKSKLVMSFSRAAKPSSTVQYASMVKPGPSSSTQDVSFSQPGGFGGSDGYVHGPNGGAGDVNVDSKAASYISYVREKRMLEESLLINGRIDEYPKEY